MLVVSWIQWILQELPVIYHLDYFLHLERNATSQSGYLSLYACIGTVQFPEGYLMDKYGRRHLYNLAQLFNALHLGNPTGNRTSKIFIFQALSADLVPRNL